MAKPKIQIAIAFADPLPIGADELALIETDFSAEIASLLAEEAPSVAPDAGP